VSGPTAVCVGDAVPPFTVAITLQRLVMEAGANRDFSPIHFDAEVARASGAPHAFANTTLNETLIEAALREWAGLGARIRTIAFRMRDFNAVGDVVSATGTVTAVQDDGRVELDVWIESDRGRTVQGSAVVELPAAEG
jgi:acyl dehydratase